MLRYVPKSGIATVKRLPSALLALLLVGLVMPEETEEEKARAEGYGVGATIAVLPPDITLREISAGGSKQERDDWSETAKRTARETVQSIRPENYVYFTDLEVAEDLEEEMEEVMALYQTIDVTLMMREMNAGRFPHPRASRRQSVGSVDRILDAVDADSLLVVYGVDDIFTTDRKALVALGFVANVFTSAYTGVAALPQPSNGDSHLSAALIARDGRIIWRYWLSQDGIGDLRTPDGVRKTLLRLLETMPSQRAYPENTTES